MSDDPITIDEARKTFLRPWYSGEDLAGGDRGYQQALERRKREEVNEKLAEANRAFGRSIV